MSNENNKEIELDEKHKKDSLWGAWQGEDPKPSVKQTSNLAHLRIMLPQIFTPKT